MITVCCHFAHSFKIMHISQPVCSEFVPPHNIQRIRSDRGVEVNVLCSRCIKGRDPIFMNFGISLRREFARFTLTLGSKLATILSGRLFTPTFSMQKQSELLYWAADPSTEVFNSSMFLNHLAKLELLPRLGLKISTLTPG